MLNITEILEKNRENENGITMDEAIISYRLLYEKVRRLSERLPASMHTNVGVFLPNSISYIIAVFAVQTIHKIPVPMSPLENLPQIRDTILATDQYLILTDSIRYGPLKEWVSGCGVRLCLYNIDNDTYESVNNTNLMPDEKDKSDPNEVAIILKTSGTLGNPKCAMLTHHGLLFNINAHICSLGLTTSEVTLIHLPMCFGYCYSSQLLAHFVLGAQVYIASRPFNPSIFLENVYEWHITNTTVVPSILSLLSRFLTTDERIAKMNSLHYLCFGGAKINLELVNECNQKLPHTRLVQTYGLTEHSPRITTKIYDKELLVRDSVGNALQGVHISIRDTKGNELHNGYQGEIWVKSPSIMKGYYGNTLATQDIIKNGWLDTGDIGFLDADSELHISGRKKNIIIRSGININPEEIENCILQASCVDRVCVTKEDHPVYGENPIALVKLNSSADPGSAKKEILELCRRLLPTHKLPSEIRYVQDLESTITGKVKRK